MALGENVVSINEGFAESVLVPLVTPEEATTPLHMFSKLVDDGLVEHLTFETVTRQAPSSLKDEM